LTCKVAVAAAPRHAVAVAKRAGEPAFLAKTVKINYFLHGS